ncbi:hypothetical protein [Collinsella sp. AF38-3AC]|uniref:hypothetical protein n=1 Tax=Collinsella sp. AF38-3AC TaxID=2292015 RepID=UPI0018F72A2C|nr:hypothetical protein [Collinsella sp. AF38-3AC]
MKKYFVLVNKSGLPYISIKRNPKDCPLVGICSDLASAKALMKAFLESRDKGQGLKPA